MDKLNNLRYIDILMRYINIPISPTMFSRRANSNKYSFKNVVLYFRRDVIKMWSNCTN